MSVAISIDNCDFHHARRRHEGLDHLNRVEEPNITHCTIAFNLQTVHSRLQFECLVSSRICDIMSSISDSLFGSLDSGSVHGGAGAGRAGDADLFREPAGSMPQPHEATATTHRQKRANNQGSETFRRLLREASAEASKKRARSEIARDNANARWKVHRAKAAKQHCGSSSRSCPG